MPYTDERRTGCSGGRKMFSVDSCQLNSVLRFILKAGAEDWGSRCRASVVTAYEECIIQYQCIHSLRRGRTDGGILWYYESYRLRWVLRRRVIPQQVKTRSGVYLAHGEINFGSDSEVQIETNMEEKAMLQLTWWYGPEVNCQLSTENIFLECRLILLLLVVT